MVSLFKAVLFECPSGSSLEVSGMTSICYRETDRQVHIAAEVLIGSQGLRIFEASIQEWEAAPESLPISDSERRRIVCDIREALLRRGYDIEVVAASTPLVPSLDHSEKLAG
ncbi:MAG: hypothetical protein K1Y02_07525 [Candidatus Hydrogenedentes bacterium]|nr:hypothetical protein [Candidatus Hydrogenedentota bacterium]